MRPIVRLLPLVVAALAAVLLPAASALAGAPVTAAPGTIRPGGLTTITVGCGSGATSASLNGTAFGGPAQIAMAADPNRGPGAFSVTFTIPASTLPGTYDLPVTCNTGVAGQGTLVVAPSGVPATGGGSASTGANRLLLLGGLMLLVIAGAGVVLLRRTAPR